MSFTEITDDFEGTVQHLKQGAVAVAVLSGFFKMLKKGIDSYASLTLKIGQNLKHELPLQSNMDTLSTALSAFTQHIGHLTVQTASLGQSLQSELIEPLDLFYEHYNASNAKEIAAGSETYLRVKKAREQMLTLQQKYFKAALDAEKFEARPEGKTQKQLLKLRTEAARAGERYIQAFELTNQRLVEHDEVIPEVMGNLQQNEESRVHFIKYTLEKYARAQQRSAASLAAATASLTDIVGNINSGLDVRVFVDSRRTKSHGLEREEFLSFEAWKKKTRDSSGFDDFITLEDEWDTPTSQDAALIKAVVNSLVPYRARGESSSSNSNSETDEPPEFSDLSKLTDLLQTPDGRSLFCDQLERRRQDCSLSSYNLTQLAALFNSLLTCMLVDNDTDPCTFYRLIGLAQTFFSQSEDGRRRYLNSLISSHQIWADKARWESCIAWVTATKISADRESMQKLKSHTPKKSFFGTIKSIANKLPQVFQKEIADEKADKSASFMILSQFNFHMINLGLAIEAACDVVLRICSRSHLDSERICVLLAELQANQRGSRSLASARMSSRSMRLKRRESLNKKWGELLPIAQALEFLPIEDLLKVVAVCKQWHLKLRKQVYLVQLRAAQGTSYLLQVTRSRYWLYMLQPDLKTLNYNALLEQIQLNPEPTKTYDEIIRMDVARSFKHHPLISSNVLMNLLRTYAYYNPEVGYCQGMNYIAGTLYLQIQDEETAFRCMVGLIERHHMAPLFYQNMPKLKLYLYQLDRLVGINLPEIHSLFQEEMITSSHFASSWFITLFSSVLHQTPERLDVLLQIWDMFFIVRDM
jgi:hypothetical protein